MFNSASSHEGTLGVGIRISDNPPFRVIETVSGSPAHSCGKIRIGDVLLSVDDVSVHAKTISQVTELFSKGRAGSQVKLKFARYGKDSQMIPSVQTIMDFSALPDLSVLSMADFPTISLPDLSFTPGKAGWSAAGQSEIERIGKNEQLIFEVLLTRNGTNVKGGILKSASSAAHIKAEPAKQLNCTNLSTSLADKRVDTRPLTTQPGFSSSLLEKRTEIRFSTPQAHCKDLKSSSSSVVSDDGSRDSKFR